MNNPYGTEAAFYQGLNEHHDPEVAADLGIPTPETVDQHIESAQKVRELLAQTAIDDASEYAALEAAEGRVICANCNRPGCSGCGRS